MNLSTDTLAVLSKLKPPFARSATVLFPYSPASVSYPVSGLTVEMEAGETAAVAAGTGAVAQIYRTTPAWRNSDSQLARTAVAHVVIDHGWGVTTTVGGLSVVSVQVGQTVQRGAKLGDLLTAQMFFNIEVSRKTLNPALLGRYWVAQNGVTVIGQGGKIRFAPDRLVRDLSAGVVALWNSGLNYFKLTTPAPLLVNISFNGSGSVVGGAAAGYTPSDYWNVYTPVDYTATATSACYASGFYYFSEDPVLPLNGYDNTRSPVVLERIAPLFSAASSGASWSTLLQTWIGGYVGPVPYENTFRLHNLVASDYELYLYANNDPTDFYVSVNLAAPTVLSNNPTVATTYVEGQNYVKYTLTVPAGGYITLRVVGSISGLQLLRV